MIYLLTFTFLILQCLDWYTTRTILKNGGREQNPLMNFLFNLNKENVDLVMCIKALVSTAVGYFIGLAMPLLLIVLIIIYLVAVIHNAKSIWKL
jgi:hypothetical protein